MVSGLPEGVFFFDEAALSYQRCVLFIKAGNGFCFPVFNLQY